MYKVVYNVCYGGFSLSREAGKRLIELGVEEDKVSFYERSAYTELERHDPRLVQVVEELKDNANGVCAKLRIKQIDSNQYMIDEYDGSETVITPDTQDNNWITIE